MAADPERYAGAAAARTTRLLALLGTRPAHRWTAAELHAATTWPLSSLRRHLAVLVGAKYAHRNPDGKYSLGSEVWLLQNEPEFFELLVTAASEPLIELRNVTEETALLTVLDGPDAVCLAQEVSRLPLLAQPPYGDRFAACVWAPGRAMLASLPRVDRERLLPDGELGSAQLTAIHAGLDMSRDRGYAVDRDEVTDGVSGIAVPVPNMFRLAAIGVILPTDRMPVARESELGHALAHAATATARQLAAERAARLWAFNSGAGSYRPSTP